MRVPKCKRLFWQGTAAARGNMPAIYVEKMDFPGRGKAKRLAVILALPAPMAIRKIREESVSQHDSRKEAQGGRLHWPYPRLNQETVLAIGVALLSLCLYPFWGTVALAAIFAFGLKVPLLKLRAKLRLGRRITVWMAVASLLLALLLPAGYLGLRLYQVAAGQGRAAGGDGIFSSQTSAKISGAYDRIEEKLAAYGKRFKIYESTADARQSMRESISNVGKNAVALVTGALLGIPDLVVSLLIFSLFFYLFLAKGEKIGAGLVHLGIIPRSDLDGLVGTFQRSCRDTIVTNIILGTVQASFVAIGARIGGFREMAVIFTLTFFLSFIPIIGASPVAFFLAGVSFLVGNSTAGIVLLVTGAIAGSIDNILRPFLISAGDDEGHPILSFAAIIGAIMIFGLKGLFLGPVIITVTFALLKKVGQARA